MAIRADRVGVRQDQVDIHGRVTSPSFLNELLEGLPEWTDMPVWVNGTEELLPSDNSVPVTSPILADIAYPDIRRDNQYFTYRESPTPVDGLAKIKSIKGNTLKWNQLIYNGNFTSTDGWVGQSDNPTLSVADNAITVTMTSGSPSAYNPAIKPSSQYPFIANHKYLFSFDLKATKAGVCLYLRGNAFGGGLNFFPVLQSANTWTSYKNIVTATNAENIVGYFGLSYGSDSGFTVGDSFSLRNLMMIDLTALGIADKTNAEILQWFADYFPLNYYSYNAGTLLSFTGTGLKTVGKNLFDENLISPSSTVIYSNIYVGSGTFRLETTCPYIQQANLFLLSGSVESGASSIENGVWLDHPREVVSINGYVTVASRNAGGVDPKDYQTILFNPNTSDNTYEPYTTSTTSLPISTYFPTGMKSAGTVYDELTPIKSITRIGAVDLGSLTWTYSTQGFFLATISDIVQGMSSSTVSPNVVSSIYTYKGTSGWASMPDMSYGFNNTEIRIKNTAYNTADAFKSAMSGVYLFYELATPVELPTMSFE